MTYPISDVTRRVVYSGSAGTGPYTFTFEVLTQGDIGVYKNSTLLTLTTDYTVTINVDGTGYITLVSAATAADTIAIFGNKGIQRSTDFVTGGDLFANSLNDELDAQTIFAQQNAEAIVRSIRAPQFDPTGLDMTLPAQADRVDGILQFDSNGEPTVVSASQFVAGLSGSIIGANYITNNATGDGTTVNFTLSSAPGSKGNLQIYIDGVYQNKATFSLTGTTVTFTEAPPLNASVEFIIGYSVGSFANAGDVPFTQQGSGASTRTVEAKLYEFVSVKDFGAVGDGVTDDTAAIQAAIDAVTPVLPGNPWDLNGNPGGTVFIPQGKYKVSSTITIPAWVNVKGAGKSATQLVASGSPGTVVSMGLSGLAPANDPLQSYHCSLSDLTIYGNSLNVNGLDIYASFWHMYNVEVTYCNYNGIFLQTSYTGKAYNTYVFYCGTSAGYAGIKMDGPSSGYGANDVSFIGGSIGNCYDSVRIKQSNGVFFYGMSIQSSKRNGFNFDGTGSPTGITIRDCYFESNAEQLAGSTFYGLFSYVTIENNYFAGLGVYETKYIAGSSFNGMRVINNLFSTSGGVGNYIGLVDEAAISCTFLRNTILGNAGNDDSIPLFTTALKAFVDDALYTVGSPVLSKIDHLNQYNLNSSQASTYTVTFTPSTSGTITLTSGSDLGAYTVVDKLVHVQGAFVIDSVSSPVGTAVRISLPFPIADLTENAEQIGGAINQDTSIVPFSGNGLNSYINMLIDASTVSGGQVYRFSFSYLTA